MSIRADTNIRLLATPVNPEDVVNIRWVGDHVGELISEDVIQEIAQKVMDGLDIWGDF